MKKATKRTVKKTTKQSAVPATKTPTWLIALIVVLAILILFFTYRTYHQYTVFKSHRLYFQQSDATIQPWMTVRTVERRFNISQDVILQELNTTNGLSTDRMTLESICKQRQLNCTAVIAKLNHD